MSLDKTNHLRDVAWLQQPEQLKARRLAATTWSPDVPLVVRASAEHSYQRGRNDHVETGHLLRRRREFSQTSERGLDDLALTQRFKRPRAQSKAKNQFKQERNNRRRSWSHFVLSSSGKRIFRT